MTSDDTTRYDLGDAGAVTEISVPRQTAGDSVVEFLVVTPLILIGVVAVVGVLAALSNVISSWAIVWAGLAVILLVTMRWFPAVAQQRARRAWKHRLGRSGSDPYPKVVERHLKNEWDVGTQVPIVLRDLAERRIFGLTMRSCDDNNRSDIEPLTVSVEPIPLDESAPAFASLAAAYAQTDEPGEVTTAATSASDSDWQRGFDRNLRFAGGWLPILGAGILLVIVVVDYLLKNSFDPILCLVALSCAASWLSFGGRGAWRSRNQWLLIPGGIVMRKPARSQQQWDLHVFDRRESVLLAYQQKGHTWRAWVADATHDNSAQMTRAEAEMLLRFWLSPLTPPPVEQLTDLE